MAEKRVIVAGAGPAGFAAAIRAAMSGARVTILEGSGKPGRKLLTTGNGRCNLTNLDDDICRKYHSDEDPAVTEKFVSAVMESRGPSETIEFFRKIGLPVIDREGWVYPRTGQAQSVLRVLMKEAERLRIRLKCGAKIEKLSYDGQKRVWNVRADGWDYEADCVILACGSSAAPDTGSDGSGYKLAGMLGIRVVPPEPVLTGMLIDDRDIAAASGARTPAKITLTADGRVLHEETGEIQWAEYGISGIAVFQLSRFLKTAKKVEGPEAAPLVHIDFAPDLSLDAVRDEMRNMIDHFGGNVTPEALFGAFVHERAAAFLSRKNAPWTQAAKNAWELSDLTAKALKSTCLPVRGTRSLKHAQTASGGVALSELRAGTLESVRYPGLFFAGEIIDIDGPCGGYNLQWAWSSGDAAGASAAEEG